MVRGFPVEEGQVPGCACLYAILVAVFFLYFLLAIRRVGKLKTLPERRKQYLRIAAFSFISAPLAVFTGFSILVFLPASAFPIMLTICLVLMAVFVLYGLISLSRARDVRKQQRFYSGNGRAQS